MSCTSVRSFFIFEVTLLSCQLSYTMCAITGILRHSKHSGYVRLTESVFGRHEAPAICLQLCVQFLYSECLFRFVWNGEELFFICSSRKPLAHIVQDMKTNGQLGLTLELSHLPLENFCWIPGLPRTHTRQKTRCFLVCHYHSSWKGESRAFLYPFR